MQGQVTWFQLALSIFLLERDNNKLDCCQQALFLIENLLCGSHDTQSRVCTVFLLWHDEK